MPRVRHDARETCGRKRLPVFDDFCKFERGIDIFLLVEERQALRFRVLPEYPGAIVEDELGELFGRRGHEYGTAEPVTHQLRDAADMIKVRMRHDKGADALRLVRKRLIHRVPGNIPTLLEAAIDENLRIPLLDKEIGAGDGTCASPERELQRHTVIRAIA